MTLWRAFQLVQHKKILLPMQETQEMQVQSLGQEDPLEQDMATHSSVLTWLRVGEGDGGRWRKQIKSQVPFLAACGQIFLHSSQRLDEKLNQGTQRYQEQTRQAVAVKTRKLSKTLLDIPMTPLLIETNTYSSPQNIHILILRTCEYVTLHGKEELSYWIELRLLII